MLRLFQHIIIHLLPMYYLWTDNCDPLPTTLFEQSIGLPGRLHYPQVSAEYKRQN